ncbi:MAG: 50S ribosomal protein L9 [Acidimicrobiales bacterium]
MRVILRADVDGVGKKGDVVDVADGHGRNLLIPKGLALKATPGAERQAEGMRRSRELTDAAVRSDAAEMAERLSNATITIGARAGEGGKLFGSVTTSDVANAVHEQAHVVIDRRALSTDESIKDLGSHTVKARVHPEVEFDITVEVVDIGEAETA